MKGFNPCFNGSSSSTYKVPLVLFRANSVSILVLMEVPLQQGLVNLSTKNISCFNPCFNGSSSSTIFGSLSSFVAFSVSILVLMEVPLQPFI